MIRCGQDFELPTNLQFLDTNGVVVKISLSQAAPAAPPTYVRDSGGRIGTRYNPRARNMRDPRLPTRQRSRRYRPRPPINRKQLPVTASPSSLKKSEALVLTHPQQLEELSNRAFFSGELTACPIAYIIYMFTIRFCGRYLRYRSLHTSLLLVWMKNHY